MKSSVQAILSVRPNPSQVIMKIVLAAMKPYIIVHAIVDFAKNVDSLLHTMAIESDG